MKRLRCGFSHNYVKLYEQTSARLLEVMRVNRIDICKAALHYDTLYFDKERMPHFYALERGPLLRLVFIGNRGIPFTTYRTDTPENYAKYADNIGKVFQIYVKEDGK